jgi:hypothetical protein
MNKIRPIKDCAKHGEDIREGISQRTGQAYKADFCPEGECPPTWLPTDKPADPKIVAMNEEIAKIKEKCNEAIAKARKERDAAITRAKAKVNRGRYDPVTGQTAGNIVADSKEKIPF